MKPSPLLIAAGLVLLCGTGSLAEESNFLMTREEMKAVWQESCARMNTQFEMEITMPEELSPYFRHGNDLIITSLPMEGDLPLEKALERAKTVLRDKFDIPSDELDAMGVYPRLQDYVYLEDESEWEFYFTPVRDTDVTVWHPLPDGGEYLAVIGARTGNVIKAVWYREGLAEQILEEKAWEAALMASEMSPQEFAETFAPAYVHHYDRQAGTCLAFVYHQTADQTGGDNHVYQVVLDCRTGDVVEMEYTNGVG